MAKGILDKVDLSQQQPQKGANLSYEKMQSSVQPVRPSAGLLKQVLSRSKESEQFSPYKKKEVVKPTKIAPQTPTPSPEPVQARPILTEDVLEPIAPMEQRISRKPETAPAPKTPEKPFVSAIEPLEETRKMAVDFEGKIRDRINQMADAIYESPSRPDKAKDVWKEEIRTGMKDGSIHAVVDEQGNLDIKRKAPSLFEAFWEGQKSLAEGLREGSKYQFESDEERKNRLENNYISQMSSLEQEEGEGAAAAAVAGGVAGQVLLQTGSLIPFIGPAIRAASVGAMTASQDLQSEQEAYNIARQQNLDINQSFDIAKRGKYTYLTTGLAENLISNLVGGRLLKAGAAASTAGKGFINASKQLLKASGSKAGEIGLDAAVAATASVIRDARLEAVTGGDVDIKERALDNAIVEIAAGGALTGLGVIYGQGKQYLPKWFKSQSLNMASNLDETFVKNSLEEMQRNGQIDEAGVKTALEDIQKWNETKKNNPDIPEEKAPTLIGYFTQKQNLEESLKKADESSQPLIIKKIEDINKKIAEARTNPEPLATEQDDIIQEPIVKTTEDATTISQEQERRTEGDISQYQGVEGQQDQAPNEADNRNRPISGKTQQEVVPRVFDTEEGRRVISEARGIISKTNLRQGNKDIATETAKNNVVEYIKGTKLYENANDVDREQMLRSAQKYFFKTRFKSSPSIAKLFGELDPKKITVEEKSYWNSLMKAQEQGQEDEYNFIRDIRIGISNGLKSLESAGKINNKQFISVMSKYDRLNLKNPKAINKFVEYASNIIKDANYEAKIKEANGLRDAIKRNASKQTAQVNLSNTAKAFAKINPADAENIDTYINVAGNIFKGMKISKAGKDLKVNFSQAFSDQDINDYTQAQRLYIEESAKQEKMTEYQDLVDRGVISSDMSFSEMEQIISAIEEKPETKPAKDKERNIRAYVNKRFNTLATMAKSMIDTGNDGFGVRTEDIEAAQKKRVKDIIDRGIEKMPIKDAYRIIEAFDNFITNGTTSGLDAVIARYDANVESENLYKAKVKSRPLKLVFSNQVGKFWGEAFDSVPIKLIKMFGSIQAPKIARAMGLADLENNKSKAVRIAYDTDKAFVNEFNGKKANGDSYDSAYNVAEQGMLGFVRRNIGGNDQDLQNEFNRRKTLIEESIDALTNSNNDEDSKKAELYQQAYERILAGSNNIADVESKTDAVNREVVDWWTNEWSKHYDKLRDVNINIYNQDLGKDNNYNPDIYKKIVMDDMEMDSFNNSSFSFQYDYIPQKQSGTLIKAERPSNLPEGRFIDLSFSKNNSRALKSALVDIYTAKDVRKVDAFLKADATAKMINKDDLKILRSSIGDYIKRSRGMEGVDINEFNKLQRVISSAGRFVTSAALGSVVQPFKQTAPLIIKTMINTNGDFAVKESVALALDSQSPVNQFLNNAGYGISIRGIESSTGITALDNLIKDGSENNFNKFMNFLDKWNESILKYTVSNPDKWVARAAWVTYYKKALKDAGVDTTKIDWSTHQVVPEAADYAQSMVDTQQNVSDRDLMGKFMGSKNATTAAARNLLMPFSGFIMNAKSKMQADVINLLGKGSPREERIASGKSLAGTVGEMLVFNAIVGATGIALWDSWRKYSGTDESEREQEKKFEQAAKSATTNFATDILSPFPQTNALVGMGINKILNSIDPETPDELKFRLYGESDKPIYQDFGLLGIGAKKITDLTTTIKEAKTGEFESEAFGKKTIKKISDEDREMLKVAAMMQTLYAARIIPLAELATLSNKITRYVERRALTEKQSAMSQAVSEQKVEGATTKVNGEDIAKALSKALNYKDPETRANYLIQLEEQYKDDFIKSLGLAEESKILDGPTAANFIAKKRGVQDEIDIARLFSYKDQKARVFKLMKLREGAIKEGRLLEFYEGLRFGMQFKVFNKDGVILYAQALDELVDQDDEEINLLLQAIED